MQKPFQSHDRLREEEQKIQEAISAIIPLYMLDYMREHPAFKEYMYTNNYFNSQKNHDAFVDTEYLNGKILYAIGN